MKPFQVPQGGRGGGAGQFSQGETTTFFAQGGVS